MKKLYKWLDNYLEEAVLVMLLIAITIVMTVQIIMRFIFNNSLVWPEEFNRLCFIVSAFFSLGYCIRKKKMLRVDIVVQLLPKRLGAVVDYIGKIVALAFYIYIFYGSFGVVKTSYAQQALTPAVGFPWYIIYACITIGFGLAIIRAVQELVMDAQGLMNKEVTKS